MSFFRKPHIVINHTEKAFALLLMVLVKSEPTHGFSDVYLERLSRFLPFENEERYQIMDDLVSNKLVSEIHVDQHSYYSLTAFGICLIDWVDLIKETDCLINDRSRATMCYLEKMLEKKESTKTKH